MSVQRSPQEPRMELLSLDQEEIQWLCRITDQLRDLKFGSLHIVIHEGRIVQLERTEKHRYDMNEAISLYKEKGGKSNVTTKSGTKKSRK
ncbi:YezD family protein [Paenibacillus sp. 1001270B_150601_E10]|uniref:YezD family protein n=1 Tax=Paenibacillus sp. 1001270B_150601_E10 TaxID=2787079 RepID=UPI001E43A123|nr:YezD family protein [Paenibacillus sp. 1001270B_150601_E10]